MGTAQFHAECPQAVIRCRENDRWLRAPMCRPAQKANYRLDWLADALKSLKLADI